MAVQSHASGMSHGPYPAKKHLPAKGYPHRTEKAYVKAECPDRFAAMYRPETHPYTTQ